MRPTKIVVNANNIKYFDGKNLIKNAPETANASPVLEYANIVLSFAR